MNSKTKKIRSVKVLTILAILLALSGVTAIASADDGIPLVPNMFYGTAILNGADAPVGTTIAAYIGEELKGSFEIDVEGWYYIGVDGNESDEGKTVNFTICGVLADETAIWHASTAPLPSRRLDLSAGDDEAPVVTNPSANPESIPPNGTDTSRLNVTVTDNCAVDIVTVNLSAIGGSDAQVMECTGGDVYSTITNASVDTPIDDYCLQVNASDIAGNYDDSVCIVLRVTNEVAGICGDTDGDGMVNMTELFDAIDVYIAEPTTDNMDLLFCVIDAYIATA
jgi:hypothetical protein